jgi:2-desacetyl-2-hydroxyethyl bacteriochlorophyllide A dehydrogenase
MKTIVLEEPFRLRAVETPPPGDPAPGEAIVRIRRVGICGSDLHGYRGDQPFFAYPRILGHELGVEVVAVGAPADAGARRDLASQALSDLAVPPRPGDRCAVEPYLNCGRCVACRRGKTNCCVDLKVLGVHTDGGMRECLAVPLDKLHRSDSLALDQLALVEMLGIGAHAVSRATPEPGEWVLVVGAGPIGLSVVQFASMTGARILAADVSPARLAFCQRQFPAVRPLDARQGLREALEDITAGEMPTTVFDATGNRASMQADFGLVAHGGRLVFVGLFQGEVTFSDPDFHRRELTLFATRNATAADFRRIISLMEAGRIDVLPWITHRATFDTLADRFQGWLDPEAGVVKALVEAG